MDIGNDVQRKAREDRSSVTEDATRQLSQLSADLRDVSQLFDALKGLEDIFEWQVFQRILIEPTKERVRKQIERLNKDLAKDPNAVSQLIYNNAFYEVLTIMSDFKSLRKKYAQEQVNLQGRIKKLEEQNKKDA